MKTKINYELIDTEKLNGFDYKLNISTEETQVGSYEIKYY